MGLFDRNPEGGALAAPMVVSGGGGGGITWADPVDSNITFDAHDTYAIGSAALAPSSVYAGSGGFVTDDGAGINTSVYQGGMGSINSTNQFWIELYSNTDPDGASNVHGKIYTDGGATPSLDIFSAEKLWLRATANIALYSGAASTFRFQKTGVANTIGDVWTATGVNGEGYWAAPGGGGANTSLSNLVSPTAINQDLTFNKSSPLIETPADASDTQQLTLRTGDSSGGFGSGQLYLTTGTGTSVPSGQVQITTGIADGGSGQISLVTGGSNSDSSGSINITTGTGDVNSGDINLTTGSFNSGVRGSIILGAAKLDLTNAPLGTNWLPDQSIIWNLGSASFAFAELYVAKIFTNTGNLLEITGDSGIDLYATGDMTYDTQTSGTHIFSGGAIRFYNLSSDPGSAQAGDVYYNTTANKLKVYTSSGWETVTSS